jgi:hypothetical protein
LAWDSFGMTKDNAEGFDAGHEKARFMTWPVSLDRAGVL